MQTLWVCWTDVPEGFLCRLCGRVLAVGAVWKAVCGRSTRQSELQRGSVQAPRSGRPIHIPWREETEREREIDRGGKEM